VKGDIVAEVQAGNCDITEFQGPLNLKVGRQRHRRRPP
jgi:hypothetical protein